LAASSEKTLPKNAHNGSGRLSGALFYRVVKTSGDSAWSHDALTRATR
jgi:hypothetical protein